MTKHNQSGEILMELGNRDWAGVTVTWDGRHGEPFNSPTGIAIGPNGKIYVSDGYGNRRIHRFAADGTYETAWGIPGGGPGEFALVHNVGVDENGRVYGCDRENNRIQIFDGDGNFITEWTDMSAPGDIHFPRRIGVRCGAGQQPRGFDLDAGRRSRDALARRR